MLYRVRTPADNQRGPRYVEAALNALHGAESLGAPITLELASVDAYVGLFVRMSRPRLFIEELRDAYPSCQVQSVAEDALEPPPGFTTHALRIRLTPDVLSLATAEAFEDRLTRTLADPISGILSLLRTGRSGRLLPRVILTLRPARSGRYRHGAQVAAALRRRFRHPMLARWYRCWCTHPSRTRRLAASVLLALSRPSHDHPMATDTKLHHHLFETHLTILVAAPTSARRLARGRLRELAAAFGRLTSHDAWFTASRLQSCPHRVTGRGFLLAADEIATLWHPPVSAAGVARLDQSALRELEPPAWLPSKATEPDVTTLGRVRFRTQRARFGIRLDDLRRHLFVCGRTGTGKTTLLQTMVCDGIESGRNVCLVDPHGDLVENVLRCIPRHRTNDVILFDAGDRACPVAFNPLHCPRAEQRPLVADAVVASLKRLYGDSWGPRLEQILRNGVLALLEHPGSTLLTLSRLLTDTAFRTALTERLDDPVVRTFWLQTFAKWHPRFRSEAVSPVLNKLDGFLASPIARAITCDNRNTIDLRAILDNPRTIFLCNLSKGRVGEGTSSLLGSFLVAALQTAALSRADLPETRRPDALVYIDEFHSFVSEGNTSFATILSESRKYRVAFAALATQFLDQIDMATLSAVLGNCGSTVCFRCGVRDAETMALQLGGDITPADILGLPNFTAYARVLVNGEPTRGPFSMVTTPPLPPSRAHQCPEVVRRTSRHRYGRSAAEVSRDIAASLVG